MKRSYSFRCYISIVKYIVVFGSIVHHGKDSQQSHLMRAVRVVALCFRLDRDGPSDTCCTNATVTGMVLQVDMRLLGRLYCIALLVAERVQTCHSALSLFVTVASLRAFV